MLKGKYVYIDIANNDTNEYIIKDVIGITLGRIFIVEYSVDDGYCSLRIKLYKTGDGFYEYLREIIHLFCRALFSDSKVRKINIYASEQLDIRPFSELGFQLEGIVSDRNAFNNERNSEYLFGVHYDEFEKENLLNVLRLYGNHIILKVLTPEDSENILSYYVRNKEYLKPYEPAKSDKFYTLEIQKKNIEEYYRQYLNGYSINFGIYKGNNFIGKIQLSNIVLGVFKNAFVGYSIDKDEQGKGYMKEALELVIRYAFDEIELHRIEASTLVDNFRSQGVLKHCGFKQIGLSEKYLFIDGKWRDHLIFCRIKD